MIDIRQFFKVTKISFVEKTNEHNDVHTFAFASEKKLHHIAGQHGIFILPKFKGIHIFSLASAPEEKNILIGTHAREGSHYKTTLSALKSGDTMTLVGPVMNFILDKRIKNVVFLAQGIGITPFRSILMHKKLTGLSVNCTLIHVDSQEHTYREISENIADITYYPVNPEEFTQNVTSVVSQQDAGTAYYVSGSPRFVKATKQTLQNLGVAKRSIKKDGFLGY